MTTVTSKNRKEFMQKEMEKRGIVKKEEKKEKKDYSKMPSKLKPHGIWHSESNKLHSHHENEEKAYKEYEKLGSKMADHSIGELTAQERKEHGYE